MDATTTRASTVIKSIPTRDTRTHASITIPLSRTRSSTSMRLVPPGALSTGIEGLLEDRDAEAVMSFHHHGTSPLHRSELTFERPHLLPELFVLGRQRVLSRRQMMIELPPVESDLLRLVDGTDQKTNPDREQLDFGQRYTDIARHHEPFVENAIEHVDQTAGSPVPFHQGRRHRFRTFRDFRALALLDCLARTS